MALCGSVDGVGKCVGWGRGVVVQCGKGEGRGSLVWEGGGEW